MALASVEKCAPGAAFYRRRGAPDRRGDVEEVRRRLEARGRNCRREGREGEEVKAVGGGSCVRLQATRAVGGAAVDGLARSGHGGGCAEKNGEDDEYGLLDFDPTAGIFRGDVEGSGDEGRGDEGQGPLDFDPTADTRWVRVRVSERERLTAGPAVSERKRTARAGPCVGDRWIGPKLGIRPKTN